MSELVLISFSPVAPYPLEFKGKFYPLFDTEDKILAICF
jgi:hypothetical protein